MWDRAQVAKILSVSEEKFMSVQRCNHNEGVHVRVQFFLRDNTASMRLGALESIH
jgi:hypothetical protein